MSDLYQKLSDPFPPEMERKLSKGGTNLIYIPISEVINRLNKVLGVDRWSFTIIRCERDATDPDFVVAHVRIEWDGGSNDWSRPVIRDGFGGQKIKRTKQNQIVDLGDEFKGAISDALKKAAQTLGVGLYLARSEDAIEIEQVIEAEVIASQPVSPMIYPKTKEMFDSLDSNGQAQIKKFWSEYSNGAKKTMLQMSEDDLLAIQSEIVRIKFNAETVPVVEKITAPERRDLD